MYSLLLVAKDRVKLSEKIVHIYRFHNRWYPGRLILPANCCGSITDYMTFSIDFEGDDLNFDAPHLKVQFFQFASQSNATGDLLSQTISIPEPEIYAMLAVAMGVMGWVVRRKKRKQVT